MTRSQPDRRTKQRGTAMVRIRTLTVAAAVVVGLLAPAVAQADPRDHRRGWETRGWYGDRGFHHHRGGNGALAGALAGLGVAAVVGGIVASQPQYHPPPVVTYAPPPAYYPAPGYYAVPVAPAPVYAAPPYPPPRVYYAPMYGQW